MNRYKTIERRLGALIIDSLVLAPLALIGYLARWLEVPPPVYILWLLAANSAGVAYHILMHGRYGQTLGKMSLGVKVLRAEDETPIDIYQAYLREIPNIIFALIVFLSEAYSIWLDGKILDRTEPTPAMSALTAILLPWVAADIICCLMTQRHQAVHDLIGGTVVVRTGVSGNSVSGE